MGRKLINKGNCLKCKKKCLCRGLCKTHYSRLRYEEHERARRGAKKTPKLPIGARRLNTHGYVSIKVGKGGRDWKLEHRVVMEKKLKRKLTKHETVHHINGITTDNRIQNLELWASRHVKGQRVADLLKFAREIIKTYAKAS